MLKFVSNFILFLSLVVTSFTQLSAKITETNEISTIQTVVSNDALVLFNVSDVLYLPGNTLADHQWRTYFTDRVNALVSEKAVADRIINKVKHEIVTYIPKKPVEACTQQIIANMQNQHIPVFGITQKNVSTPYADNFGLITQRHLLNLGIDLAQTLSYLNVKDSDDTTYTFAYGMIFTKKKDVGPAVFSFIDRLPSRPSKVVLIDNSLDSLESTEQALLSKDIQFEGFRYGRADASKANFDAVLGTIEFFAFFNNSHHRVMSDDDALQIKQNNPKVDFALQLDHYILEQAQQISSGK